MGLGLGDILCLGHLCVKDVENTITFKFGVLYLKEPHPANYVLSLGITTLEIAQSNMLQLPLMPLPLQPLNSLSLLHISSPYPPLFHPLLWCYLTLLPLVFLHNLRGKVKAYPYPLHPYLPSPHHLPLPQQLISMMKLSSLLTKIFTS